jgi:MSHA biogenesis protein MshQ
MKANSVWLNYLTRRPRRGAGALAAICAIAVLMLAAGAAQAATFNFNGSNVVPVCPLNGTVYTCSALPNSSDTDVIIIANGYTVAVSAAVNFSYNQSLQMNGTAKLTTSGSNDLSITDMNPSNLNVNGGTFAAGGTFSAGNQAQTFRANITGANIDIGTGSTTKITGSLSATNQVTLASNVSIIGNVSAPTVLIKASNSSVKGNISAPTQLTIESNNTVNGSISGGALTMNDGGVVINGDVSMTGDVSIGSSGTINGNLVARNVTTKASGDIINGNAAVNAIYLDWGASVSKTITCTGPGAAACSCVTKADPSYKPTCGAAATSGAHHIQITHADQALTCQAASIELKACADSACNTTYTGASTVSVGPNGGSITFSGTGTASVRYPTATDTNGVNVSATSSAISNANVCVNTGSKYAGNSCQIEFKDQGLVISAPDHLAAAAGVKLSIQAYKNSAGTCVPLVQNASVPVQLGCAYSNPAPAYANPVPVTINGSNVACNGSTTSVNLQFDGTGLATPTLKYTEVGRTTISASYTGSGANANLVASGSDDFYTAPDSFLIEPVRTVSNSKFSATAFARASETFTVKLTALNVEKNVTQNFGRESPAQNFSTPTPQLITPAGGAAPITQGANKAILNGVADPTAGTQGLWHFDETGTLRITVRYADQSGYYLGRTSATDFNKPSTLDLLFVPDHFDVTLAGATLMNCAGLSSSNNPCGATYAAGDKFLYSKQPFDLLVSAYTATKDAAGVNYLTAKNYVGTAARNITLSAWNPVNGNPITVGAFQWAKDANKTMAFASDPNTSIPVGKLADSSNYPSYVFSAEKTPPTSFYLRATDDDGATSQRSGAAEPRLTVVAGHLDVANVNGALNSVMPVAANAQYFNGSAYVFNPQFKLDPLNLYDTVAGVTKYYITFSNCQNGLDLGGNKCPGSPKLQLAAPQSISFKDGKGTFLLSAPSPTLSRNGSTEIRLQSSDQVERIPYLPSGSGRVTFGVYRSGPVIYSREVY